MMSLWAMLCDWLIEWTWGEFDDVMPRVGYERHSYCAAEESGQAKQSYDESKVSMGKGSIGNIWVG